MGPPLGTVALLENSTSFAVWFRKEFLPLVPLVANT